MSLEILHTISGKFTGTFSTNQSKVLEEKDFLDKDKLQNKVKVFEGNISDIKIISPTEYNNSDADFNFNNLNNIQVLSSIDWPYENKRIFSFGEFALKNAKIENTWFENNKTYGIISGDVFGTVLKGTAPEIDSSENEDSNNSDRQNNNWNNNDNTDRDNTDRNKGCLSNINPGCLNLQFNSGCWKWLKWLFWIILLLWLLRQCVGNGDQMRCYWKYIKLEKENKQLDEKNERLERELEGISDSILSCSNAKSNGLNEITINHHDLGKNSGQVEIYYYMYSLPDMLEVYYDGSLIASTDSLVSNQGKLNFNYNYDENKPTYFTVKVIPGGHPDTKWDYSIICP
jgi:hypothetical protein